MAKDVPFGEIFVEDKALFAALPVEQRYYKVTFFLKEDPNIALKNCKVIVDNDDMNPLVSNADIGDILRSENDYQVHFRLKSALNEQATRQMYVKCDNVVTQAVTLTLQ
jgi:hypothetical protein